MVRESVRELREPSGGWQCRSSGYVRRSVWQVLPSARLEHWFPYTHWWVKPCSQACGLLRQDMNISFPKSISDSTSYCTNNEKLLGHDCVTIWELFWRGCVVVRPTTSDPPLLLPSWLSEYVHHQTEQKTCKFALVPGEVSAIYALCLLYQVTVLFCLYSCLPLRFSSADTRVLLHWCSSRCGRTN